MPTIYSYFATGTLLQRLHFKFLVKVVIKDTLEGSGSECNAQERSSFFNLNWSEKPSWGCRNMSLLAMQ